MTELSCEAVGAAAPVKTCSKCGVEKPRGCFYKRTETRWFSACKTCEGAQGKARYRRNRERRLEANRAWYHANKAARSKSIAAWKSANREARNAANRRRRKERYESDELFRLKCQLRARTLEAIKSGEGMKQGGTRELLGADWLFIRAFLEARFLPGMSWEDRDAWHIDHVVPCDAFDLRGRASQLVCFNYRNLRPTWGRDNQAKNATVPADAQARVAAISRCLGATPPVLRVATPAR